MIESTLQEISRNCRKHGTAYEILEESNNELMVFAQLDLTYLGVGIYLKNEEIKGIIAYSNSFNIYLDTDDIDEIFGNMCFDNYIELTLNGSNYYEIEIIYDANTHAFYNPQMPTVLLGSYVEGNERIVNKKSFIQILRNID